MNSLNHLLIGTDLSKASFSAIERGLLVAHHSGARCTILHALGLDALGQLLDLIGDGSATVSRKITEHQREALQKIVAQFSTNKNVSATIQLEDGLAGTALPAFATASEVDLILIGAHGAGFVQRILLGSTASRLLRKSKCPVLIVKKACRGPYRRALIAVDFSPASEAAIDMTKELAAGAHFILMHVFDVPFEGMLHYANVSAEVIHQYRIEARQKAMTRIHGLAHAAGLAPAQYTALVQHGDATRQILTEEKLSDCDLVAMGKHGTHVTEELLLGSVTKRVLAESRSDVLVVVDKRVPAAEASRAAGG